VVLCRAPREYEGLLRVSLERGLDDKNMGSASRQTGHPTDGRGGERRGETGRDSASRLVRPLPRLEGGHLGARELSLPVRCERRV